MKVTNVKIKKVDGDKFDRLRAYVDVTLDDVLVIHGLKLMQGEQGLFVAMPSRKMRNEEFKDHCSPYMSWVKKWYYKSGSRKIFFIRWRTRARSSSLTFSIKL